MLGPQEIYFRHFGDTGASLGKSLKMSTPIEITAMERVVQYMLKVQKCPSHRLPRIAWEASKRIQKTHKKQNFVFQLDARYGKMVW